MGNFLFRRIAQTGGHSTESLPVFIFPTLIDLVVFSCYPSLKTKTTWTLTFEEREGDMLAGILQKLFLRRPGRMRNVGMSLFPTSVCDTGCAHCCDNCNMKNPTHFTRELAQEIVKDVKREKVDFGILFTGNGEPLMAPELLGIADVFGGYKNTRFMTMITSGFIQADGFRKSQFEALLERPYGKNLQVEQSFNLFHPSFPERLTNSIELMAASKSKRFFTVRTCMSLDNRHETWGSIEQAICAAAKNLDATHCYMLPVGWHKTDRERYFPWIQEMLQKFEVSPQVAVEASLMPHWCVIKTKQGGVLLEIQPISLEKIGRGKNIAQDPWSKFVCGIMGIHNDWGAHLSVRTNGDVYPECSCPAVEHMRLGTIGIDSLSDITRRKDVFAEGFMRAILLDRRMFDWGTFDVCNFCQQIVAERGIALA